MTEKDGPLASDREAAEAARALVGLDALGDIADVLAASEDFLEGARGFLHHVMGTLLASQGAVYLLDEPRQALHPVANRGLPATPIVLTEEHVKRLSRLREPSRGRSLELEGFHDDDLLASIAVRGRLLGMLRLGQKFMGEAYTERDLDLLKVIACNASIALFSQGALKAAREASQALRRKVLEMETLRDVGLQISALRDLKTLCSEILESVVALVSARAGLLCLLEDGALVPRTTFGLTEPPPSLPSKDEPCRSFLDSAAPVVLPPSERTRALGAEGSVLAVAIRRKDRILGALLLLDKEGRAGLEEWGSEDASLLSGFAAQASIAIENARLHEAALEQERVRKELQVAAEIQRNLLPQKMPQVPGFAVAASTRPCRTVGGDYFDFLPLSDGRLLFVVADVAGKGIPAALLVFTLSASIHALVAQLDSGMGLARFAALLNRVILSSSPTNRFITCFLGIVDPAKGTLTGVNAGHNPPLLLPEDGGLPERELRAGGLCFGILEEPVYVEDTVEMPEGSVLALYSDGATEAKDLAGDEYGVPRLLEALRAVRGKEPEAILAAVTADIDGFVGAAPQFDDLTVVILRRISRAS